MTPSISPGDVAPAFDLPDQHGRRVSLADLLTAGPVVVFFYPLASSGGCTREACHFRDLASEFAAAGAQCVGISTDPVVKQKAFDDANTLGYPLLSDESGAVVLAYGVKRGLLGALAPVKRRTFVIAPDGLVQAVISGELRFEAHADGALAALR